VGVGGDRWEGAKGRWRRRGTPAQGVVAEKETRQKRGGGQEIEKVRPLLDWKKKNTLRCSGPVATPRKVGMKGALAWVETIRGGGGGRGLCFGLKRKKKKRPFKTGVVEQV